MERNVDNLSAGHLDVGDILIEKGLHDDHLIALLDPTHEHRQHPLIRAGGDNNLSGGIECAVEVRGVSIGERFPERELALCVSSSVLLSLRRKVWTYRGWRILVAIDVVESFLRGVDNELRRVVTAAIVVQSSFLQGPGAGTYKKPCPRLITGVSVAAAASLTIDL